MDMAEKVRENRMRRKADRMGYQLTKSRTRDPEGIDFGLYALINLRTGKPVNQPIIAGNRRWMYSWSLDEVEDHLYGKGD